MPLLPPAGQRHKIISVVQGRASFAAAPEPKSLLIIHNGMHVNCAVIEADRYQNAFVSFTFTGKAAP